MAKRTELYRAGLFDDVDRLGRLWYYQDEQVKRLALRLINVVDRRGCNAARRRTTDRLQMLFGV